MILAKGVTEIMKADILNRRFLAKQLREDPPPLNSDTGEEYSQVQVRVNCSTAQQVMFGQIFNQGEHTYTVYENQVEGLRAMVEPASVEQIAAVEADVIWHTEEIEAQKLKPQPKNPRGFVPSFAASFRHLMHRDQLPFRSVDTPKNRKRATG